MPLLRQGLIPGLTGRFNPSKAVSGKVLRLYPLGISVFYASELRTSVGAAKNEALAERTLTRLYNAGPACLAATHKALYPSGSRRLRLGRLQRRHDRRGNLEAAASLEP